ncbi:MAG TPA: TIGR00341 family protein [Clostridiales bacterium]|nr:TIGR00341 family protein [Clostridiales bacterium]
MTNTHFFIQDARKSEISGRINADAEPTIYYYVMVALSCIIATFGLLLNSTAVIIGAMLISPLMTPIIGISLGASEGSNNLFRISMKSLVLGALMAVFLSVFLSLLMPERLITAEILSRTKTTLFDLIIAMASGAAGTYTICCKPSSTILPGVAISTALMPPLCIIGIGFAFNDFTLSWGAFLLFLANTIAIGFSSIFIFNIFGFKKSYDDTHKVNSFVKILRNNIFSSIALLLIISVPLLLFMLNTIRENKIQGIISSTVRDGIGTIVLDSEIASLSYEKNMEKYRIDMVIRSTQPFTSENIRKLENLLEYKLLYPVAIDANIVLVQSINEDKNINGYNELFKALNADRDKPVEVIEVKTPEELIGNTVEEKITLVSGAAYDHFHFSYDGKTGIYDIVLFIRYDGEFEENMSRSIIAVLEDKLKRKVNLSMVVEAMTSPAESSVSADEASTTPIGGPEASPEATESETDGTEGSSAPEPET